MFGFLNINKPPDCTSHDVVAILRKSLGIKKTGHSGTLDPFAGGVLVIGVGDATRLLEYLPQDKIYLAEITFGTGTDTDDITGQVIKKSNFIPSVDEIKNVSKQFFGKIRQKPPIYSAIKINGNRSYDLARENKISQDKMNEREIEIYSIEIILYTPPRLNLKIHCSGGTYIRSLARDLGNVLNSCAVLSRLQRITGNGFTIQESVSPELINKTNIFNYLIQPQDVIKLKKIHLDSKQINEIMHGREIKVSLDFMPNINKNLQMLDTNDRLIGIGLLTENYMLKPKKIFLKEGMVSSVQT
ncbi:MAG: tRNA pseudouridine(55) synthase TruB [Candidatus Melainabacteria bacterium RIFCSPLOWO2_12_FULL_35_11]|nr:MAG: tRNA pseudouridine(55) synthase TruB [Candidatus Melainabacteria bacterium RIFCSPLOWO2_12_FULL_35_11]